MIRKIADNIYSPLGFTTDENYAAVKQGCSMLRSYPAGTMDLPEPFTASLFDWDSVEPLEGFTRFERIVIQSVSRALTQTAVDVHSERLLFILATTKGNVELLDGRSPQFPQERTRLPSAVQVACFSTVHADQSCSFAAIVSYSFFLQCHCIVLVLGKRCPIGWVKKYPLCSSVSIF